MLDITEQTPQIRGWDLLFPHKRMIVLLSQTEFVGDPSDIADGIMDKFIQAQRTVILRDELDRPIQEQGCVLYAALGWDCVRSTEPYQWWTQLPEIVEGQDTVQDPDTFYISHISSGHAIATRARGAMTVKLPYNLCGTKPCTPTDGDVVAITSTHLEGKVQTASAWSYTPGKRPTQSSWSQGAKPVRITGTRHEQSLVFGQCEDSRSSVLLHHNQKQCGQPQPYTGDVVMAVLEPNERGLVAVKWWCKGT